MKEKMKELVEILNDRGLSQIDISSILLLANHGENILDELIKHSKQSSKDHSHLMSDLLKIGVDLITQNRNEEDISDDINNNNDDTEKNEVSTSVYTIKYERENNNDDTLHVAFNPSNIGELRILGLTSKPNFFCVALELAYMDLDELKNNTRDSIEKIDLYKYDEKMDYSFQTAINNFEKDFSNYKQFIIWSKKKDTNGYLLPYYFINKYYEQLIDKRIIIIYVDALDNCNDLRQLKIGQFEELMKTMKVLTKSELKDYSDEWEEILSHKCDIRNYVNGKLEYKNIEDYYEIIKELLKKDGEVVRTKFIGELMNNNILVGGIPDIYSYIIDTMIEKGIIVSRDYKIPNCIPADKISVKN